MGIASPPMGTLEPFYRELMELEELPPAPEITHRLVGLINREKTRSSDLAEVIAKDQLLAARLLQLANSALLGARSPITTISQAVTRLGFVQVLDLVLGMTLLHAFDSPSLAGDRRRILWTHATGVAAAAKNVAQRRGLDGVEAFTVGLLHDIGKLVLGFRLRDDYWTLLDTAAADGRPSATAEVEAFGCHHATVGGWLLQLWGLPPALVEPVALHHDPLPQKGVDLAAVVNVADTFVNIHDPATGLIPPEAPEALAALIPGWLTSDHWRSIAADVARERRELNEIFGA